MNADKILGSTYDETNSKAAGEDLLHRQHRRSVDGDRCRRIGARARVGDAEWAWSNPGTADCTDCGNDSAGDQLVSPDV